MGIGGILMSEILAEAFAAGRRVTIHVEKYNPAIHFYQRLGFQPIEDKGVYWLMACSPPATAELS
jgi:ribosomal protein S18 acetylase RimI-like enzyme